MICKSNSLCNNKNVLLWESSTNTHFLRKKMSWKCKLDIFHSFFISNKQKTLQTNLWNDLTFKSWPKNTYHQRQTEGEWKMSVCCFSLLSYQHIRQWLPVKHCPNGWLMWTFWMWNFRVIMKSLFLTWQLKISIGW